MRRVAVSYTHLDVYKRQEQNAFTCNKTDLLSKMVKVTGSSFEYEYDGKKNMTAARNSEGVQYRYTYDTKGNPQDVVIHHDRVSTSVMAGRSYYIRHRKSGKYIDVKAVSYTHLGERLR